MVNFRTALFQKNKVARRLLNQPEIQGVGVGYANPDHPNRGGAMIVYTHKNVVPNEVRRNVNRFMESKIPVRYIESGLFNPRPAIKKRSLKGNISRQKRAVISQTIYQRRHRPVPGGVSIGRLISTNSSSLGTGGLVTLRNNQYFLLTNNHVAIRANQFTTDIYQPGPFEVGRSFTQNDLIGRPSLFVRLITGQPNLMDAAIVGGIPNDNIFNPRYIRPAGVGIYRYITVPGHLNAVRVGERVFKSGRTTGFTTGTIESVNVEITVGPYQEIGNANIVFRNQVVIAGQQAGGDSGSVWLREGDNYAAALHFAGSPGRAIATPIAYVMNTFGMLVAVPSASGRLRAGTVKNNRVQGDYRYSLPLSMEYRRAVQQRLRRPTTRS